MANKYTKGIEISKIYLQTYDELVKEYNKLVPNNTIYQLKGGENNDN